MDLNGGPDKMFPVESLVPIQLFSQITSFVDNSIYHFNYFNVPGSLVLQEAFSCISKFAGTLLLWFASGSNSNSSRIPGNSRGSNPRSSNSCKQVKRITSARHNVTGFSCNKRLNNESSVPLIFGKIWGFGVKQLCREAQKLQSFPMLSLAAALVPPLDTVSRSVLAVPLGNGDMLMQRCMDQSPCEAEHLRCSDLSSSNLNCTRHKVEPKTGIEFPTILDYLLDGETNSCLMSEVLVGTGFKSMRIIKIKSLKVYAFGFYIHPYDLCEKLGSKYASIPSTEVNRDHKFYEDLLREDISMTVRLVVSCNGMKISTVKEAFEKSLRARLEKANPDTDYDCLRTFGSFFLQDIPISLGTTIDFRRTADGHLITEIGGNQIGAVRSKDLCRALFDMYIGDFPVCEQTKEEIGRNAASIIRRC